MVHRKIFLLFALCTMLEGLALGQEPCSVKLANLPPAAELRGFQLGMNHDQVKARVPQVVIPKADNVGLAKTSINPAFDPKIDQTSFADVRTVSLDFVDGRVTQLWIGFENTFKWKTIEEFVAGISQALQVPSTWTSKGRGQQLQCADFSLAVMPIAGGPSLRISDLAAERLLVQRRQAKADETEAAENGTPDESVVGDNKSKTYFPADCEQLKAVAEKNRIKFNTSAEAEKAGYHRTQTCQ